MKFLKRIVDDLDSFDKRLERLEIRVNCLHKNTHFSKAPEGTYFIVCDDCDKVLGKVSEEEKLESEIADLESEIRIKTAKLNHIQSEYKVQEENL